MTPQISELLGLVRSNNMSQVADELTTMFEEQEEKIEELVASQSDLTRAYHQVVQVGSVIQRVSVSGQSLPVDFGSMFANAIQQLVVAQISTMLTGLKNSRSG